MHLYWEWDFLQTSEELWLFFITDLFITDGLYCICIITIYRTHALTSSPLHSGYHSADKAVAEIIHQTPGFHFKRPPLVSYRLDKKNIKYLLIWSQLNDQAVRALHYIIDHESTFSPSECRISLATFMTSLFALLVIVMGVSRENLWNPLGWISWLDNSKTLTGLTTSSLRSTLFEHQTTCLYTTS